MCQVHEEARPESGSLPFLEEESFGSRIFLDTSRLNMLFRLF